MSKVQTILEAATTLFARNGYERTSVAEIASAAEVANGTVIYHFKSKENLLHVIAWNTLNALHRRLHTGLAGGRTGLDAVERCIKAFYAFVDENPNGVQNFLADYPMDVTRGRGGSVGHDITALRSRMLEMLTDCISTGIRDGSIRDVEPIPAASGVASMLIGSAWLIVFNGLTTRHFEEEALELARGRLAPRLECAENPAP
ncbi:MAG: TetR/AcrR family transcriptional regulator [Desulfovibrionaceae bacterium]